MYQKKKVHKFFRKSAAVIAASVLTVSAGSNLVLAADSYTEIEKESFDKGMEKFAETYDNSVKEYNDISQGGVRENFTLHLEDAGRSLLGFFIPMDISWLNDISLSADVSFGEDIEAVDFSGYLNNTKIISLLEYLDFSNDMLYMKVPELSDSYMKGKMNQNVSQDTVEEDSTGNESSISMTMSMDEYMKLMSNLEEIIPESSVAQEVIERYVSIVLDNISDGAAGSETLSVEGVSQDCKYYEGEIHQEDAQSMAEQILNTAKEDEQLKNIIETADEKVPDTENLYDKFLNGIEKALADVENDTADDTDDTYFVSKIWVDDQGNTVGRQLLMNEGIESTPIFTYQMPQKDGVYGYLVELGDGDSVITLVGSGDISDTVMNGNFNIALNSVIVASVELQDYDVQAAKEGYGEATYVFYPQPGMMDEESYNVFANFSLILHVKSSEDNSAVIDVSLASAGAVLGTLTMEVAPAEKLEIPDFNNLGQVYDLDVPGEEDAYNQEINWDGFLENFTKAGMPDELSAQLKANIDAAISGEQPDVQTEIPSGETQPEENSAVQEDTASDTNAA